MCEHDRVFPSLQVHFIYVFTEHFARIFLQICAFNLKVHINNSSKLTFFALFTSFLVLYVSKWLKQPQISHL